MMSERRADGVRVTNGWSSPEKSKKAAATPVKRPGGKRGGAEAPGLLGGGLVYVERKELQWKWIFKVTGTGGASVELNGGTS